MKIIRQDKPNFIIDLAEANTGDYALEDILILYDETCNSITFPRQDTIKGNPTFYLQCTSNAEFDWTVNFTTPDYMLCSPKIAPSGKTSQFPVNQNKDKKNSGVITVKPLAGGVWVAYLDAFATAG